MVANASGKPVAPLTDQQLGSISAELGSILSQLDNYVDRVARLAVPVEASDREDVAVALREAERQLNMARRAAQRAQRTVDG